MKKKVSGLFAVLLLISMLTLSFDIQQIETRVYAIALWHEIHLAPEHIGAIGYSVLSLKLDPLGETLNWEWTTGTLTSGRQLLLGHEPDIAFDAFGNARAVWMEVLGTERVLIRTALFNGTTRTWEQSETISRDEGGNTTRVRVALDPYGAAIVVWECDKPAPYGYDVTIRYSTWTPEENAWSAPGVIDSGIFGMVEGVSTETLPYQPEVAFIADLAQAPGLITHQKAIVTYAYKWHRIEYAGPVVLENKFEMKYSEWDGSTFTPPAVIPDSYREGPLGISSLLDSSQVDISPDNRNNTKIVWDISEGEAPVGVWNAFWNDTSKGWDKPAAKFDDGEMPSMSFNCTNIGLSVYNKASLVFNLEENKAWIGGGPINVIGTHPRVSHLGNDVSVAVYEDAGSQVHAIMWNSTAGTWDTSVQLSNALSSFPAIAASIGSPTRPLTPGRIEISAPQKIEFNYYRAKLINNEAIMPLGFIRIRSIDYLGKVTVRGFEDEEWGKYLYVAKESRPDRYLREPIEYSLQPGESVDVFIFYGYKPKSKAPRESTYQITVEIECGRTYVAEIVIRRIGIKKCINNKRVYKGGKATFSWTVEGGSWAYLESEVELPPGWSYSVDPPIGTVFETPYAVTLNITAAPDAKEGDIGIVTLRAFSNETKLMFWQFVYFAALDNTPPTTEEVQTPVSTPEGLLFNVTVKDLVTGIDSVQLFYSVNDGPWNNETMEWFSGDTFNSTTFTLTIPPIPENSTLTYYVVATDWLGNQATTEHDVRIVNVTPSKTVVGTGFNMSINATVANQGNFAETFNVTLYANTTQIGTQTVDNMPNGTSTVLTFTWNTTGWDKGNYTISANATIVPGETDTADNTRALWVIVSIAGDITGDDGWPDGKVDMIDVRAVVQQFGLTSADPEYNSNYDVVYDLVIDMMDIRVVVKHFGETDP